MRESKIVLQREAHDTSNQTDPLFLFFGGRIVDVFELRVFHVSVFDLLARVRRLLVDSG